MSCENYLADILKSLADELKWILMPLLYFIPNTWNMQKFETYKNSVRNSWMLILQCSHYYNNLTTLFHVHCYWNKPEYFSYLCSNFSILNPIVHFEN